MRAEREREKERVREGIKNDDNENYVNRYI